MERVIISEQDIINSICIHLALKNEITPEEVEVELMYDDDEGFSAEAYVVGLKQVLTTFNIIEALRLWIDGVLNIDPLAAGIKLLLDDEEGIIAEVN